MSQAPGPAGEPSDTATEPARAPAPRSTDRRIIALAIPALGSLAVEPLYVLVDTAVVGRLGTAQLGGLALSATVLTIVVAGCNFLTYGTTERVARRLGAGRTSEAADVGVQTVWLSILVGLALAPVIGLAAPWLARGLGGDGDVLDFAVTYLRISAVGVPFVVFTMGAQGVQRGAADYKRPLVILLSANLVNTVLELVFVFGLDWGVPGSAWSTVIAQVLAGLAFAVALTPPPRPARHRRPSRAGMAPLMTAGKYLILRVGSMMVVMTGATAIAAPSTSRRWPPTRSRPACSVPGVGAGLARHPGPDARCRRAGPGESRRCRRHGPAQRSPQRRCRHRVGRAAGGAGADPAARLHR